MPTPVELFLQSFLQGREQSQINRRQQEQILSSEKLASLQRAIHEKQLAQQSMRDAETQREFSIQQAFREREAAEAEQRQASEAISRGLFIPGAQPTAGAPPQITFGGTPGRFATPQEFSNSVIDQAKRHAEAQYNAQASAHLTEKRGMRDDAIKFVNEHPDLFAGDNVARDRWLGNIITGESIPVENESQVVGRLMNKYSTALMEGNKDQVMKMKPIMDYLLNWRRAGSGMAGMLNYNLGRNISNLASETQAIVANAYQKKFGRQPATANEWMSGFQAYAASPEGQQHLGSNAADVLKQLHSSLVPNAPNVGFGSVVGGILQGEHTLGLGDFPK